MRELSNEIENATKAAERGNTDAMRTLGDLLREAGDLDLAASWYRRAADGGNNDAMHALGITLGEVGDFHGAEVWYRRAADNGHLSAMSNLGSLLQARGDLDGAETWYRWAARGKNSYAMSNLGAVLAEKGDLGAAEMWYMRASGLGNTGAMHNLGHLLKERGDLEGAEAWFRRSVDSGNTATMLDIGMLHQDQGDLAGAEAWFRRADEAGEPQGSTSLDSLERKRDSDGDLESVAFDTFGWGLARNRDKFRRWRISDASLAVRFIDGPSDFRSWQADEIREDILERLAYMESPTPRVDDLDLPGWFEDHRPTELPEQVSLLEVACFEVGPAKCVQAMYRHRMHGGVHYSTGIFILFASCFWLLRLEVDEGRVVGEREGAVARRALEEQESARSPIDEFDPYGRQWDGMIPIADDPLTRMRLLAARLRSSIQLGRSLWALEPFAPVGE